jgi:hypothetical protein
MYIFSLVLTFFSCDGACLGEPGDKLQLCRGIEGEHVDGHHHRHTELLRVLNLNDDKKASIWILSFSVLR